jgi:hypothetical protein
MTFLTSGTVLKSAASLLTAARSAGVSGPVVRAATTGIGIRFAVPNGAARAVAFSTGALAGRNLVLLLCVTLDSDGRKCAHATATTSQATTMTQRKRTLNRPRAPKTASTFMRP